MPDHLNATQLAELKQALVADKQAILGRDVELGEKEPDPGDRQDLPTEEARLRTDLTVSDHDREQLAAVEAALTRMERDTYGICEETGDPIPFARLQAQPTTRYTVEALEILEEESARSRVRSPDSDDKAY